MNACLSPRERVRLALDHRETDRIPIAMVCAGINPAAHTDLEQYLQEHRQTSVEEFLAPLIDIKGMKPDYAGPPLAEGMDIWGVRRRPVSYGLGVYDEIAFHPLAQARILADVAAHSWPDTNLFDYSSITRQIKFLDSQAEYCLMAGTANVFEKAWYMRGFQNIFLDLATQPEFAHAIFERVTNFLIRHLRNILAAGNGRIDLFFTADDIAGQNGLLLSLGMWEEHIKPYHVRINQAIHEFGAKVIYHSDGAVMAAVSGFVEMGIDVLQALQFDAKEMDPVVLKSNYGDRLCFEGGVSVQSTLPFGTPDNVRQEVEERISILGKSGGYILGPSHAIQDGTPPENIVAMFDAAADFRRR